MKYKDNGDGTATFSGTPRAGLRAVYHITIVGQPPPSSGPILYLPAPDPFADNNSQHFTLVVVPPTPLPITGVARATFTEGKTGQISYGAPGLPVATITEAGALPSGLAFQDNQDGTALVVGTPDFHTGGTYPITLVAAHGVGGTTRRVFTIAVVPQIAAPISSARRVTFTTNSLRYFTVTAPGSPLAVITEQGHLPYGLSFHDNGDGTAYFGGLPERGSGGVYPLIFLADHGVGGTALQVFTLTVNDPPQIGFYQNAQLTTGAAGTFTMATSGYPAPNLAEVGALPTGMRFKNNGDGTASISGTPAINTGEIYNLTWRAINALGKAVQIFTLEVDQPPTITSVNHKTIVAGQPGSIAVKASGFPAPLISVMDDISSYLTVGEGYGSSTIALSGVSEGDLHGNYPLTWNATNLAGSAAQVFSLTIDQPAAITSPSTANFAIGRNQTFLISTTGYPVAKLTESGALPAGLHFAANSDGTATISGTPAVAKAGAFKLNLTATNGISTHATQGFTLFIAATYAPLITSTTSAVFTAGVPASFTVTTSASPIASLLETGSFPVGLTFADQGNGTAIISGTPHLDQSGKYLATFSAANSLGNDSQVFALYVQNSPAITSADSTAFAVGFPAVFLISATGYPAATITETGALPPGVTFDDRGSGSGVLGGLPPIGTEGVYPLTFTAHNSLAPDVVQKFMLTIGDRPGISSAAQATFAVGSDDTFTVSTTGASAVVLSESGTLPAGLTFTSNGDGTATLAGSPSAGTGGAYSLTITAHNGGGFLDAVQHFTLQIDESPSISSANTTIFAAGKRSSFTVRTTGYPAPEISESGVLPSGLDFFDAGNGTAVLSGTPDSTSAGTYFLTIRAFGFPIRTVPQQFTLIIV